MATPHLALRGHHFLCTLHFQGAGYSTGFTGNMTALCAGIAERGTTTVEVAAMADPICSACPSLQPDGQSCATQDSVMRRDSALLDAMGWAPGQVKSLEAPYWAVLDSRDELIADLCTGCEWLPRCREKGPNGIASPLTRGVPRPS
jgi:hypothetical protein